MKEFFRGGNGYFHDAATNARNRVALKLVHRSLDDCFYIFPFPNQIDLFDLPPIFYPNPNCPLEISPVFFLPLGGLE